MSGAVERRSVLTAMHGPVQRLTGLLLQTYRDDPGDSGAQPPVRGIGVVAAVPADDGRDAAQRERRRERHELPTLGNAEAARQHADDVGVR